MADGAVNFEKRLFNCTPILLLLPSSSPERFSLRVRDRKAPWITSLTQDNHGQILIKPLGFVLPKFAIDTVIQHYVRR